MKKLFLLPLVLGVLGLSAAEEKGNPHQERSLRGYKFYGVGHRFRHGYPRNYFGHFYYPYSGSYSSYSPSSGYSVSSAPSSGYPVSSAPSPGSDSSASVSSPGSSSGSTGPHRKLSYHREGRKRGYYKYFYPRKWWHRGHGGGWPHGHHGHHRRYRPYRPRLYRGPKDGRGYPSY